MPYEIKVERVKKSKIGEYNLQNVVFGRIFTDHMLTADYHEGAWQDVQIMPFQNLSLHPATTALHYGQEIFEGLKAYLDADGQVLLFRPRENWIRMNASARRMCMPEIPEDIFMDGLHKLVSLDRQWIPSAEGSSLYIRPFMISTDEYVGIKISDNYKFVIFGCPVNAYYPEPIKVKLEQQFVRASPGGTGEA
jgi:branched-chain amino acid aminotransferase